MAQAAAAGPGQSVPVTAAIAAGLGRHSSIVRQNTVDGKNSGAVWAVCPTQLVYCLKNRFVPTGMAGTRVCSALA